MRKAIAAGGAIILLAAAGSQAADKALDMRLASATNVVLGFDDGVSFIQDTAYDRDWQVVPEDREAIYAVRQELERWGHYAIVTKREHADLLIAVRTRRVVALGGGAPAGGRVARDGMSFGAELSNAADMLSVYDATKPQLVPLWRGTLKGGLGGERPALIDAFRTDVERVVALRDQLR
jgi:hypothetical protein